MSDYVSHEPPCGWLKLQNLFIQKSAYLITHVDWDNEPVNFESLAQIIDYGKRALRECLERKHEADSLKEQRDELLNALEAIIERWDTPLWKDVPHTAECINAARLIVAKAKGE